MLFAFVHFGWMLIDTMNHAAFEWYLVSISVYMKMILLAIMMNCPGIPPVVFGFLLLHDDDEYAMLLFWVVWSVDEEWWMLLLLLCWMLLFSCCMMIDEYMNAIMLCLNHIISRKSHDYTMLVLADDAWYLLFMSRAYLSDDDMLLCWSNHDVWCCWIHEPLPNPSSCTWEPRISYAIGQVHCSIGNSQ